MVRPGEASCEEEGAVYIVWHFRIWLELQKLVVEEGSAASLEKLTRSCPVLDRTAMEEFAQIPQLDKPWVGQMSKSGHSSSVLPDSWRPVMEE